MGSDNKEEDLNTREVTVNKENIINIQEKHKQ